MNMVIPNEGKLLLAEWAFVSEFVTIGPLRVALYTNDYTPDDNSVYASFTQASFTGSDSIQIQRTAWDAPAIDSDVAYVELPTAPSWTCSGGGPQTCYGWMLWSENEAQAIAAQRFDTPRVMDTGSTETLDPFRIGLKTLD